MGRFVNPKPQFLTDAGDPVPLGKLFFKESGSNLDKDTFSDVNLSIPNTNPVILSASGRVPNIHFNGTSKVIFTDADSVQIFEIDPVGETGATGNFAPYNALTIYDQPDIVTGSDQNFYVAISDGIQNSDPINQPSTDWSQIRFIRVYNANETYSIGQVAQGSDNLLYSSITSPNLNNNPVTDGGINWIPAVTVDVPADVLAAGHTFAYNNF